MQTRANMSPNRERDKPVRPPGASDIGAALDESVENLARGLADLKRAIAEPKNEIRIGRESADAKQGLVRRNTRQGAGFVFGKCAPVETHWS